MYTSRSASVPFCPQQTYSTTCERTLLHQCVPWDDSAEGEVAENERDGDDGDDSRSASAACVDALASRAGVGADEAESKEHQFYNERIRPAPSHCVVRPPMRGSLMRSVESVCAPWRPPASASDSSGRHGVCAAGGPDESLACEIGAPQRLKRGAGIESGACDNLGGAARGTAAGDVGWQVQQGASDEAAAARGGRAKHDAGDAVHAVSAGGEVEPAGEEVPVGHTAYSWCGGRSEQGHHVPEGHTWFSWNTRAARDDGDRCRRLECCRGLQERK